MDLSISIPISPNGEMGILIDRMLPLASTSRLHYNQAMQEDEIDSFAENEESGSDELLAADELHLPESANVLVRLHALRAWLERRRAESELEIGTAALALQKAMSEPARDERPRRRFGENNQLLAHTQAALSEAQQRLSAYNEAATLLEECVAHTTTGERLLVEYYLSLEELIEAGEAPQDSPWRKTIQDVLHRVEQVGSPGEEME